MNSNNDYDYTFPRRINEPTMVFIFPLKQILPTILTLISFAYMGMFWIGLALAIFIYQSIGNVIKNSYIDIAIHKLWRNGFLDIMVGLRKSATVVNPMITRYFN